MFQFNREQSIFEVADVSIGGQPGEQPTVLIGSIFYEGHRIVEDPSGGLFDEGEAETLIHKQEEMSDKTGNPHFIDIVASTPEAMVRYIDFVSGVSESPFLVDSPHPGVRLEAFRHCLEVGLGDRAVYNSIDENVKSQELEALREMRVETAVVMAFNSSDPRVEGRMRVLTGLKGGEGILELVEEAGVKKILVDTAVLDAPSIGTSARTVYTVKRELGLPSGCAPANAMYSWRSLELLGKKAYNTCIAAAHSLLPVLGADFLLYGPINHAEMIFPACAMVDAFIGYDSRWRGIKPKKGHPLYKVFKTL